MHTWHGLKIGVRILLVAAEVCVHANTVHLAVTRALGLADHGNVVLSLASDDARAASDARCQIDRHPPRIRGIGEPGIHRGSLERLKSTFREPGLLQELTQR